MARAKQEKDKKEKVKAGKPKSKLSVALAILGNTILVFLIIVGLAVAVSLLPFEKNYRLYSVMSGSMAPAIPVGSVAVVKPSEHFSVGDVITFRNVGARTAGDNTTHRVVDIDGFPGDYTFTTKGDANDASDSDKVGQYRVIGRVLFSVPLIGYLLAYIKTLPGLFLIIIVPATIIIYEEARKIHREAKTITARRRKRREEALAAKKNPVTQGESEAQPKEAKTLEKDKKTKSKKGKSTKKGGRNVKKTS